MAKSGRIYLSLTFFVKSYSIIQVLLMQPAPQKRPESWEKALKFMGRCPICDKEYKKESARLFAQRQSANLVHINCVYCRSSLIAMIMVLGQGLSSVGMVTDLSFEDARRLHNVEPISLDEILEGYNFFSSLTVRQISNVG